MKTQARLQAGDTERTLGVERFDMILEAAERLFSERGYHATSVRDIAGEAGILSGSLYAHIDSKEDLLYEIVLRSARQFLAGVEMAAKSADGPEEKLRKAMRAHVSVVAHAREAARVFLHDWKALEPPRREEVLELRDRYESLWEWIIREGIKARRFRAVDARFARILVLSVANWTYTWYHPDGPLGPEEIADRLTDLVLGGLGESRPPKSANIRRRRTR